MNDGQPFGPLTIDRHLEAKRLGVYLHVFHRGIDVTRRCRFADDTPGHNEAQLLRLNAEGRPFVDPVTGGAAIDVWHGDVEIREGEPF